MALEGCLPFSAAQFGSSAFLISALLATASALGIAGTVAGSSSTQGLNFQGTEMVYLNQNNWTRSPTFK